MADDATSCGGRKNIPKISTDRLTEEEPQKSKMFCVNKKLLI